MSYMNDVVCRTVNPEARYLPTLYALEANLIVYLIVARHSSLIIRRMPCIHAPQAHPRLATNNNHYALLRITMRPPSLNMIVSLRCSISNALCHAASLKPRSCTISATEVSAR